MKIYLKAENNLFVKKTLRQIWRVYYKNLNKNQIKI